jgi:hypothetical protein
MPNSKVMRLAQGKLVAPHVRKNCGESRLDATCGAASISMAVDRIGSRNSACGYLVVCPTILSMASLESDDNRRIQLGKTTATNPRGIPTRYATTYDTASISMDVDGIWEPKLGMWIPDGVDNSISHCQVGKQ